MAQLSSRDLIVATLFVDPVNGVADIYEGDTKPYTRGLVPIPITEDQVLLLNSFIRKRWETALQETKVPFTIPPHPPTGDNQTF